LSSADLEGWDAQLLRASVQAFANHGAEVLVRDGDANWLRRRTPEEGGGFEVVVAGLPNLLHELAHAALHGELADDHGFDYGLIPLRIERADERRYLWEELSATVLSCAYLGAENSVTDAWFAEQIEIQGVFYGVDDGDLAGLRALLAHALHEHGAEAEATLAQAYARCSAWLREGGAAPAICAPRRHFSAQELWARYSRSWDRSADYGHR